MIKVYIAGKVTGEKIQDCTMKFGAWEKAFESMGMEPVNPLKVVDSWHTPWEIAMRKCIGALVECDAVFLLPDFVESKGAMFEQLIASTLGIPQFLGDRDLKERILTHPKIVNRCQK